MLLNKERRQNSFTFICWLSVRQLEVELLHIHLLVSVRQLEVELLHIHLLVVYEAVRGRTLTHSSVGCL